MNYRSITFLILFSLMTTVLSASGEEKLTTSQIEDLIIQNRTDSSKNLSLTEIDSLPEYLDQIINETSTYKDYLKLIESIDNRPNTDHAALNLFIDNLPEPKEKESFNVDFFNVRLFQIYSIRNELLDLNQSKIKYEELEAYHKQFSDNNLEIRKAQLQLDLQPVYIKTIENDLTGKNTAEAILSAATELQDTSLMIETITVINNFVIYEGNLQEYIENAERIYYLENQLSSHTPFYEEAMVQLINALSFEGGHEQRVLGLLKEVYNYTPSQKGSYSLFMQFLKDIGPESDYVDSVLIFNNVKNVSELARRFIEDAKTSMDNNNLFHLYSEAARALKKFGYLEDAISYISISSEVYQRIYGKELSQALASYERGLVEKEKEAEIAIAAAKTKFFERSTYIGATAAFVVLVLLIITFRNTLLLKKQKSELSAQRDLIESQKEDKELLLSELHHRVKNNFQIILSLLETQAQEITDDDYKQIIRDGARRIKSMATVHDCLYDEDGLDINLSTYFRKLVGQLSFSLKENAHIDTHLSVPEISVKMDAGILLGIIVNELITNSFKYGFDPKNPALTLLVSNVEGRKFELFYSDNGSRIQDVNLEQTGLGLALIKRLARQLGGKLAVSHEKNGFIIDFNI